MRLYAICTYGLRQRGRHSLCCPFHVVTIEAMTVTIEILVGLRCSSDAVKTYYEILTIEKIN